MTLLIFDIDGVLGNFERLRVLRDKAHIRFVAKKNNLSLSEAERLFFETKEKLKLLGKFSTLDTMLYLGVSKPEFFDIMNAVEVDNNIIITKHAPEVLKILSQKHKIAALTNTPYDAMVKTLKYLEIYSYFDKIYSIDKYDYVKPSTGIYKIILNEMEATSAYSIGDSVEKDLTPAKVMGVKTILFASQSQEKHETVDFMIQDLKQLLEIIKDENN